MFPLLFLLVVVVVEFLASTGAAVCSKEEEAKAIKYLAKLNERERKDFNKASVAEWKYASNITKENLEEKLQVLAAIAKRTKARWQKTTKFNWQTFTNPDVQRQFKFFSVLGTPALPKEEYQQHMELVSEMSSIYSKAEICSFKNKTKCDLKLEPEIKEIMSKSNDFEELAHTWIAWHDATGKKCRKKWEKYVSLSNKAAKLNNKTDNAEFWLMEYDADDFPSQVSRLWKQVRPLYLQLHAYVRRRLVEKYGECTVRKRGPIPAHLVGSMWAGIWSEIYEFTAPYPGRSNIDVSDEMIKQGYTPLKMYQQAEEFFTSLGLDKMPDLFWKNSIIERPKDGRDLVCHASAWDFYDSKDYRIKQCTNINMHDLKTVHHEMGHIEYDLQYRHHPVIYRRGANPGFHEAVGDTIALSVSTPKHLRKINLLPSDNEGDKIPEMINFLYFQGLGKITFLPYAYMLDQFRWDVFKGKTPPGDYNCDYWKLRNTIQGIEPPVDRSEEDFDAGAKYHVIADVPYIRYFVSFVIQFQFQRALCIKAGQFDPDNPNLKPLHECDIYESKEAGAALSKMLQMGRSKPWPEAMEAITGQREMDASGLLDYFKPLKKWLRADNRRHHQFVGWKESSKICVRKPDDLGDPTPV